MTATTRMVKAFAPIVDCHTHLWYLDQWNNPWLKDIPALNRSFTLEDYKSETDFLNIVANIFVETNPEPNHMAVETKFITGLCQDTTNEVQGLIGACNINSPLFQNHMNQFLNNSYLKGVRDVAHIKPKGYLTQPKAQDNYRFLGEKGLIFEVCERPENLHLFVPTMKANKETTFVLDHLGGVQGLMGLPERENAWKAAIQAASELDNVYCKISGLAGGWGGDKRVLENGWDFSLQEDYIRFAIDNWEPNRLLFGLDWPLNHMIPGADLYKYVEGVHAVCDDLGGEKLKNKLFHANAFKCYGVDLETQNQEYQFNPKDEQKRFLSQSRLTSKAKESVTGKSFQHQKKTFLEMYFETPDVQNQRTTI